MKLIDVIEECCPVIGDAALDPSEAEQLAQAFKVLADPARLRLLSIIAAQPESEACVCDLQEPLTLSQPTLSHHLKVLHEAGFLEREKRGRWAYYSIAPDARRTLEGILAPRRARTR